MSNNQIENYSIPDTTSMPAKQKTEKTTTFIYRYLDWLFYRKLCGNAGRVRKYNIQYKIDNIQYNITNRISSFFHKKHCHICMERYGKRN